MADETTIIDENSSTDLSEYLETLNKYTVLFENCRYDRLTYNAGESGIADIQYDSNVMNTSYYRSFGTYRHELKSDSSLVRINETYVDEDELIKQYYNYNETKETSKDTLIFAGIVLAQQYSTNGHDVALEDLFAEYGYDYLQAYDAYLKADPSTATDTSSFYFDIQTDENQDTFTPGTYSILKIGETFTNYDELDENGKPIVEEIIYDGTYHPTVDEIISGKLYIVIQSGSLNPKKVYFNNKYLPTLFINDDKRYQAKNSEFFIEENYIINGQQGIKLCDIKTYEKLGTLLNWVKPFVVAYLYTLRDKLNTKINDDLGTNSTNYISEGGNNINIMSYYLVRYKTTTQPEWSYQIIGNDQDNLDTIINSGDYKAGKILEGSQLVYTFKENINNVNIGYLNKSASDTEGKIYLEIYFGMSLVLTGYSYEENVTPQKDTYSFYWFEKKNKYKLIIING